MYTIFYASKCYNEGKCPYFGEEADTRLGASPRHMYNFNHMMLYHDICLRFHSSYKPIYIKNSHPSVYILHISDFLKMLLTNFTHRCTCVLTLEMGVN
jgi:hypothetical protein